MAPNCFFSQNPKGGHIKVHSRPNSEIRAAQRLPPPLWSPTQTPYLAPIATAGPLGGAMSPSPTHNPNLMPNSIPGAMKLEIWQHFSASGSSAAPLSPVNTPHITLTSILRLWGLGVGPSSIHNLSQSPISWSRMPKCLPRRVFGPPGLA